MTRSRKQRTYKSAYTASTPWLHREGIINGIRMHWAEAGSKDDPLVILLHGFPEFWYSWRYQLTTLSSAGFRVVAPDMRGYNLTEKASPSQHAYDINTLSDDIHQLIISLTNQKAYLAGHDWGGVVTYAVAARFPEVVERIVVLNAPPCAKMYTESLSWTHTFKLWYIALFRCPVLPEYIFGYNRAYLLAQGMRHCASHPDAFDDDTVELYRDAMSHNGALTCMLSYFRNIDLSAQQSEKHPPIVVPTLVIWGLQDPVLLPEMCQDLSQLIHAPLEIIELDCGHWAPQELPDQVSSRMMTFFQR
jgi:epoxide hydrolase 4